MNILNIDQEKVQIEIVGGSQQIELSPTTQELLLELTTNAEVEIDLVAEPLVLDVGVTAGIPVPPEYVMYKGPHKVTPSREEQTLQTANKYLADDVVVKQIPFDEVSNTSGGITFYIGKEVDE